METTGVGRAGGLLLLLLSILLIPSSSSHITPGSIISTSSPNHATYWLSPSTNFAFGFYPIPSSRHVRYKIGVWLANSCKKTLVWSLNHTTNSPLRANSLSVTFDQDGFFRLHKDGEESLLFGRNWIGRPARYASMQDNGNFVVYGSSLRVVMWQSFDHPTDTILPGQALLPGRHNLISAKHTYYLPVPRFTRHMLTMENDESLVVYATADGDRRKDVWRRTRTGRKTRLRLDCNGNLDIVEGDGGLLVESLYKAAERGKEQDERYLYSATLGSDGALRVQRERFGGCAGRVTVWKSGVPRDWLIWEISFNLFVGVWFPSGVLVWAATIIVLAMKIKIVLGNLTSS